MIDPDLPYARPLLAVVLAAVVGMLVWRAVRKDRREYRRFKRYRSSIRRRRMYRKWLLDSLTVFGGTSVVLLVLVWPYVAGLRDEIDSAPWVAGARDWFASTGWVGPGVVVALFLLVTVGSTLAIVAVRDTDEIPSVGDIQALLPRNRAELGWGAALSVNAGVVEELMFRFAVPALLFGLSGNGVVAVVGSLALFGALHIYQGAAGVIGSTIIGGMLMLVYLATGQILVAIVVHALIDLRSLVVIPVLVQRVHRRPANWMEPLPARTPSPTAAAPAASTPAASAPASATTTDSASAAAAPTASTPASALAEPESPPL